jgi:excisionase family DNA binding protein
MQGINPNEVYTTREAQELLKVSRSTMKRLLKKGLIRANKIGGQYRILGKEMLRIISPDLEVKAINAYQNVKKEVIKKLNPW